MAKRYPQYSKSMSSLLPHFPPGWAATITTPNTTSPFQGRRTTCGERVLPACTAIYNITVCSRSPRCRPCSDHGLHFDRRLLIYLRRREIEARNLQDPEPLLRGLPRHPRTLEGDVLSSCTGSRGGKGDRTSASLPHGSWLIIRSGKSNPLGVGIRYGG